MGRGSRVGLIAMALIALGSGEASGQVGENRPPGAPLHVSPSDGHRFNHGEPQRFTVAVVDPDLEPYTATVTVRDASTEEPVFEGRTHVAPSGSRATTAVLPPLPPGRYTWSARATDVRGAAGQPSASWTVEVGPPAASGGGVSHGTLEYAEPGLPKLACRTTRFDVTAEGPVAFADVVFSGFAGTVQVTGTGGASCEDMALGLGSMTLTLDGVGPSGSRLSCPAVEGPYTRAGTSLVATLTGDCEVNGFPAGRLKWTYSVQTAPLDGAGGATVPVTRTTFDGAFVIRSLVLTESGPEI